MSLIEFNKKFKVNEYKIYETKYWIWSIRPHQATLGASILSLKRECPTFAELIYDEFADLNNIIKIVEPSLKISFNYDVINYLMLMMIDKQVHYHIFPRYEKPIEAFGTIWKDENWPTIPKLIGNELSSEKLKEITQLIKSHIKEVNLL